MLSIVTFAIVVKRTRRPQKRRVLKARKRPLSLAHFQKRKKSKEAIRKAEVLAAKVEVAEVLQNKRRSVSLVDHLQFPVIRFDALKCF